MPFACVKNGSRLLNGNSGGTNAFHNLLSPSKAQVCYLVGSGSLLGVLILSFPKKAGEPDADAAVWLLSDLSDGGLVDG